MREERGLGGGELPGQLRCGMGVVVCVLWANAASSDNPAKVNPTAVHALKRRTTRIRQPPNHVTSVTAGPASRR
ncbi:hypothetical protein [Saccharopolyspora spinosa]|uniref:hypothetical protein n=1 Tax=Saccharopolyspora spinosa TaxID=60894 RepID=UPI0011D1C649|nr:hypothetical protein [Saccharopolyspora spinosa]